MKIVSTLEHYDSLAHEGHDPVYDPPLLREYMSGWDGRFVLSASYDEEWLVYGERKLALYPLSVSDYIRLFETAGFQVESVRETERKLASILVGIKKGSQ